MKHVKTDGEVNIGLTYIYICMYIFYNMVNTTMMASLDEATNEAIYILVHKLFLNRQIQHLLILGGSVNE